MKRILKKLFGFSEKTIKSKEEIIPESLRGKYQKTILKYKASILKNGYRSIKFHKILLDFGYKRKGSKNLIEIERILKSENLFCFPSLQPELIRNSNVKIYNYPVRPLKDLFETEKLLCLAVPACAGRFSVALNFRQSENQLIFSIEDYHCNKESIQKAWHSRYYPAI